MSPACGSSGRRHPSRALVEGAIPTLVLRAHDGIAARVQFAPGTALRAGVGEHGGADEPIKIESGTSVLANGDLRILVVDDRQAERLWYLGEELIDSVDAVWAEPGGLIARASQQPDAARWTGTGFEPIDFRTASAPGSLVLTPEPVRAGGRPPARFGEFMGRSSAPTDAQIDEVAALWRVEVPSPRTSVGDQVELVIEWEGDVAQLRADGVVIRDRFWDGLPWRVDITDLSPHAELTLHIVPVTTESLIDLDDAARLRVEAAGLLCDVKSVTRVLSSRWIATGLGSHDPSSPSIGASRI